MKTSFLILFTLLTQLFFSQENSYPDVTDKAVTSKLIYYKITDEMRSNSYTQSNGMTKQGQAYRVLTISYSEGMNGNFMRLDKKGEHLKNLLKSNETAVKKLNEALGYNNNKFLNGALKFTCFTGALVFGLLAIINVQKKKIDSMSENPEKNNKPVIFGASAVACLGGGYFFMWKNKKDQDNYKACVIDAIEIYNKNLISNSK